MSTEILKIRFINKALNKYQNKYDYSKVIYENSKTLICIHCNKCRNDFLITPNNFFQYSEPCCYCRKQKGRLRNNDKYSEFKDCKIIQFDKNINQIKEFLNIDKIIKETGINKIKKSDIKRCCLLNHNKLNSDKQSFNYSKACDNIWIFDIDKEKMKNRN